MTPVRPGANSGVLTRDGGANERWLLTLFGLGLAAAHLLKDVIPMEPEAAFKGADINTVRMETYCLSGSPSAKQKLHSLQGPQLLTHVHCASETNITARRSRSKNQNCATESSNYKTSINYTHMHPNMHK